MKSYILSKTKYLSGWQCLKRLWYEIHRPEEIPEPDEATQSLLAGGAFVGECARTLYPEGILIPWEGGIHETVRRTKEALDARKPIFEATFLREAAPCARMVRVDILNPVGSRRWDLIEVKSATQVKPIHQVDVAFQRSVAAEAGIRVGKCILMHLSREYRRSGALEPARLFAAEEITAAVEPSMRELSSRLETMAAVLSRDANPPDIAVGPHCGDPYECPLQSVCWSFLPEHNVFQLSRMGSRAWDLIRDGIYSLEDLPVDFRLTDKQRLQLDRFRDGRVHVDRDRIRAFLDGLDYPLVFLDLETFYTPIPLFDGLRPYDPAPFQFSVHVQPSAGAPLERHSFLAHMVDGAPDPRPPLLERLKGVLGAAGSVVVYNRTFEKRVLEECAESFPAYAAWVREHVVPRMVDLMVPFRSAWFYDPKQRGRHSLKAVLPAVTGKSYDGLAIADGGAASAEFARVGLNPCDEEERTRVRRELEIYCGLDTEGMAWIVDRLRALVE